jgi:hypothetical protein
MIAFFSWTRDVVVRSRKSPLRICFWMALYTDSARVKGPAWYVPTTLCIVADV